MNYDSLMDNIKRIHFIGIGGSGMCPLAEILHHEGYELSGSDMNEGETLDGIKGYGIPVFMDTPQKILKVQSLLFTQRLSRKLTLKDRRQRNSVFRALKEA